MSLLGPALYTFLSGTLSVGTRCYPDKLPQKPTLPAVAWYTVGGAGPVTSHSDAHSDIAPRRLERTRLQIDCWAESALGAETLAEEVLAKLHGYKGSWGDVVVGSCLSVSDWSDHRPDVGLYRRVLDFMVMWVREAYDGGS